MAKMSGKAGTVTFGTSIAAVKVTSWSADLTCDTADVTSMDASAWNKTYVPTFVDWTATVEGVLDGSLSGVIGAEGALDLNVGAAGTSGVAGNAICTGISPSVGMNDAVTVTLTFQGSGAPTVS